MKGLAVILVGVAALWAAEEAAAPLGTYKPAERRHWALQPRADVVPPVLPDAAAKAWIKTPVDAFILASLRKAGVQCTATEASACSGTLPVCGTDDRCRGCISHAECPSSAACLPDGSCASAADVAYVAPGPAGTDNATCSIEAPCTTVAKALATGRRYLKLQGTTDEAVTIKDQAVIVLADPGASLTRTSNGNILVIDGTSDVQISDLTINGASGSGAGISLPSGGSQSLTLRRVTMSGNNGTGGAFTASGGAVSIYQSTISSNSGTGGAVTASGGTVNIYQSTITG